MFYVTIIDGSRVSLAYGPFAKQEDAEACVEMVREYVVEAYYPRSWFWAYGTSRLREGPFPDGKLNHLL